MPFQLFELHSIESQDDHDWWRRGMWKEGLMVHFEVLSQNFSMRSRNPWRTCEIGPSLRSTLKTRNLRNTEQSGKEDFQRSCVNRRSYSLLDMTVFILCYSDFKGGIAVCSWSHSAKSPARVVRQGVTFCCMTPPATIWADYVLTKKIPSPRSLHDLVLTSCKYFI
jgi:hypothetical protein